MFPLVTYLRVFRAIPWVPWCAKLFSTPFYGGHNLVLPTITYKTYCTTSKEIVVEGYFSSKEKDKNTYLCALDMFKGRDRLRRGHVEFIYAAMQHMEEFGVHKDLEVYKSLLDVLPKGKFIAQNIFQVEFMHYPKQQQCAIDLLEKMEDNGVIPDREMELMLRNIFGSRSFPLRKFARMMYWMPKFKNLSPWPLPNPVPNDNFELAMLAIKRISSVDIQTDIKVYQAEDLSDSLDKTWIICAQSPKQKELLAQQPEDKPVYIEGAFQIWLRDSQVNYFILRSDQYGDHVLDSEDEDDVSKLNISFFWKSKTEVRVVPSVHEQEDGIILAVFATGTSSRDSLLSLIRLLEKDSNPALNKIPVLFTLKSPLGDVVTVEDQTSKT